ncbi:MAG: NBR1-Ig-like domain-containing protein [Anaerolineae bacterium]
MRRTTLLLICVCVGLCLVGCDATGSGNPLDVVQHLGDAVMPPADTTASAPTKTVAPTPVPTVDLMGCQLSLAYVEDLTIPDGTSIAAGELFTKTWSVLNDGTCPWGPGLTLRFVDGTPLGLTDVVALPAAEPGDTVAISVPMRAPTSLGSHRSNWRLSANDALYGTTLFALIEVTQAIASPTPEASATPSLGPTLTARPTVVPPTSAVAFEPSGSLSAVVVHDAQGLWITNRATVDWHNVIIEVNPGLLRHGYRAQVEQILAGERIYLPHGDLKRPDGTTWPPEETPWGIYIQADEGDYYGEPT